MSDFDEIKQGEEYNEFFADNNTPQYNFSVKWWYWLIVLILALVLD